jgi:tetratricopeptide (TPR) repeat protein
MSGHTGPTFTSSRIGTVSLLHQNVSSIFAAISPTEQTEFIDKLRAFRAEVETKGNAEYLKTLGVTHASQGSHPGYVQLAALDMPPRSFDRLLYVLSTHRKPQYSTPTRIAEAAPYLEEVIAYYKRQNPNKVDDTPEMYLGVALHKQPGQEEAAIAHFRAAYAASPAIGMQYSTQLWSRACFSRLLRRIGKIQDAEEQEDDIRYVLCQRERCGVLTGTGQRLAPLAPIRDAAQ